jgi:hypothetical protein
MRSTPGSLLGVLCAAACAGTTAPPRPVPQVYSPAMVEEPITAVLTAVLDADRSFATVDSLWDPEATVVADGTLRYAPPRFAGIGAGGDVAITSSRLEVRQSLVWVFFDYRWISVKDGTASEGKATVLLTPPPGGVGWRIIHAHSSTVP